MSEVNADGVNESTDGQTNNVIPDGINDKPNTVKYETYDKAMSSLAKEKEKARELQKQLDELKEKELIEQGKYKELAESKDRELKEMKENLLKEKAEKFISDAKSVMSDVANKFGAHSAEDIHKHITVKEITGADGKVDAKLVENKIDELKKTKPYLFKGMATKVKDGQPITTVGEVSLGKMSIEELKALYAKAAKV